MRPFLDTICLSYLSIGFSFFHNIGCNLWNAIAHIRNLSISHINVHLTLVQSHHTTISIFERSKGFNVRPIYALSTGLANSLNHLFVYESMGFEAFIFAHCHVKEKLKLCQYVTLVINILSIYLHPGCVFKPKSWTYIKVFNHSKKCTW